MITLAVIGIVAAMSIPSLMSSTGDAELISGAKKSYSTLSQVYLMYVAENGSIEGAFSGDDSSASDVESLNLLAPYLNIVKNCGSDTGCLYDTPTKSLDGTVISSTWDSDRSGQNAKAVLNDGTIYKLNDLDHTCITDFGDGPINNVCGEVVIDTNGAKGPNTAGKDILSFFITKTGVYPTGAYNDTYYSCVPNTSDAAESLGCTYRLLQEGAINY